MNNQQEFPFLFWTGLCCQLSNQKALSQEYQEENVQMAFSLTIVRMGREISDIKCLGSAWFVREDILNHKWFMTTAQLPKLLKLVIPE